MARNVTLDSGVGSGPQHTRLDRTIVAHLPDPTASFRMDGISASVECVHRLQGTSVIRSVCRVLKLSTSIYSTACSLFHRYFHAVSLKQADVWSIAAASILVASKTLETTLVIQHLIVALAHVYRKRRLVIITTDTRSESQNDTGNSKLEEASATLLLHKQLQSHSLLQAQQQGEDAAVEWTWTKDQRLAYWKQVQGLSPLGPVYKEWYTAITEAEHSLLRQLGFTLHWIPHAHPHKYLQGFVHSVLGNDSSHYDKCIQTIHQRAWNYCNDSFLLDVCVRYPPSITAAASVYLAFLSVSTRQNNHKKLVEDEDATKLAITWREFFLANRSWERTWCGTMTAQHDVTVVAKALVCLQEQSKIASSTPQNPSALDITVALYALVLPLKPNCFNDMDSFLWHMEGEYAKKFEQQQAQTNNRTTSS